jgi:hypothetical protein
MECHRVRLFAPDPRSFFAEDGATGVWSFRAFLRPGDLFGEYQDGDDTILFTCRANRAKQNPESWLMDHRYLWGGSGLTGKDITLDTARHLLAGAVAGQCLREKDQVSFTFSSPTYGNIFVTLKSRSAKFEVIQRQKVGTRRTLVRSYRYQEGIQQCQQCSKAAAAFVQKFEKPKGAKIVRLDEDTPYELAMVRLLGPGELLQTKSLTLDQAKDLAKRYHYLWPSGQVGSIAASSIAKELDLDVRFEGKDYSISQYPPSVRRAYLDSWKQSATKRRQFKEYTVLDVGLANGQKWLCYLKPDVLLVVKGKSLDFKDPTLDQLVNSFHPIDDGKANDGAQRSWSF